MTGKDSSHCSADRLTMKIVGGTRAAFPAESCRDRSWRWHEYRVVPLASWPSSYRDAGCHAHGFAWACRAITGTGHRIPRGCTPSMPTQSRGHGTRRLSYVARAATRKLFRRRHRVPCPRLCVGMQGHRWHWAPIPRGCMPSMPTQSRGHGTRLTFHMWFESATWYLFSKATPGAMPTALRGHAGPSLALGRIPRGRTPSMPTQSRGHGTR